MHDLTRNRIRELIRAIESGQSQQAVLAASGISYSAWRRALTRHDVAWQHKRGRPTHTYTRQILLEIRRRARGGEFITDLCRERGLLYPNLCRACRKLGIRMLSRRSLRENIGRRNYRTPKRAPGERVKTPAIFAALDEGVGIDDLVHRFRITRAYAVMCRKRHREGQRPPSLSGAQRRQEVFRLRAEGLTLAQIAQRQVCSRSYVSQLLRGSPCVPRQPRVAQGQGTTANQGKQRPSSVARGQEFARLRAEGLTLAQIAERHGCTRQNVFQYLRRFPPMDAGSRAGADTTPQPSRRRPGRPQAADKKAGTASRDRQPAAAKPTRAARRQGRASRR